MKGSQQRGSTLVEAAVVLALLFTLLLGIMEFGRAYNLYQVGTNAAREGARFAVAPCSMFPSACPYGPGNLPSSADIQARVKAYLSSANVQGATVNVDAGAQETINSRTVKMTQVRVTIPFTPLFFNFGTLNLSTQAVMRNETD